MYQLFRVSELTTRPPFSTLFPISCDVLSAIRESMETGGFDNSKPIDVWKTEEDEYVVIDGHTRLRAAQECGLREVSAFVHLLIQSEDEALRYAIHNQRDRRNLTDADILRCVAELDKRKVVGRPEKLASREANFGKSAEDTAETIGTSRVKVEKARTILDHADEETKGAVERGEKSINAAYKQTQEARNQGSRGNQDPEDADSGMDKRKPLPVLPVIAPVESRGLFIPTDAEIEEFRSKGVSVFNSQKDNDNIEWARWSWNPVTGCLHSCDYCYARDIAARFYAQGFTPTFLPERLSAPRNTKQPKLPDDASDTDRIGWRNVFVCSMADLWGNWVPSEIIRLVLREIVEQDQWTYLLLTKFPARYEEFATELPVNTWVGTSVDQQHAVHRAQKAFKKLCDAGHQGVRWLSVEPMLERLTFDSLEMFDWVVIGGASRSAQTAEFRPPFDWIVDLYQQARAAGCKVYFKTNLLGDRVREYPEEWEAARR